jgi:hypothetical protein
VPRKLALPAPAVQAKALAALKERFKSDYGKDPVTLASKLLEYAADSDDVATQHAALREARDLSASAADLAALQRAEDAAIEAFELDALRWRTEALSLVTLPRSQEVAAGLVPAFSTLLDDLVAADRYDLTALVLPKAEQLAKVAKDETVPGRTRRIVALQKEWPAKDAATLASKPDDPGANLSVGRFLCFTKGDWIQGLPHLARGPDGALKALAQIELEPDKKLDAQIRLCDGWLKVAEGERSNLMRLEIIVGRAAEWFEAVGPQLGVSDRGKFEKRLADLSKLLIPKKGIDLLAMVDARRDALSGNWTRDRSAIVSPTNGNYQAPVKIVIPYEPPDEYDLEIDITRLTGTTDFVLRVRAGGRDVGMGIDGWNGPQGGGTGSGFYRQGDTWRKSKEGRAIDDRKQHTLRLEVRKNAIQVVLDGAPLMTSPAISSLGVQDVYAEPPPAAFIVGGLDSSWRISRFALFPKGTGTGRRLR